MTLILPMIGGGYIGASGPPVAVTRNPTDTTDFGSSNDADKDPLTRSLDVGSASTGRRIWVLIVSVGLRGYLTPTLTIDGASATLIGGEVGAAAFFLDSNTIGGTVNVVLSENAGFLETSIQTWSTVNHVSYNIGSQEASGAATATVTQYTDGVLLFCGYAENTATVSWSPTPTFFVGPSQEIRSNERIAFGDETATTSGSTSYTSTPVGSNRNTIILLAIG
jgi:hypothetical protein